MCCSYCCVKICLVLLTVMPHIFHSTSVGKERRVSKRVSGFVFVCRASRKPLTPYCSGVFLPQQLHLLMTLAVKYYSMPFVYCASGSPAFVYVFTFRVMVGPTCRLWSVCRYCPHQAYSPQTPCATWFYYFFHAELQYYFGHFLLYLTYLYHTRPTFASEIIVCTAPSDVFVMTVAVAHSTGFCFIKPGKKKKIPTSRSANQIKKQ